MLLYINMVFFQFIHYTVIIIYQYLIEEYGIYC